MERFINGVNRNNTSCVKWDSIKSDKDFLSFWIADSDYPTCEFIIEDLVKRVKHGAFGYTFVDDEYLSAIQNWFLNRLGYKVEKEWITPCNGVITALNLLVKTISEKGDYVILNTPIYNPFYGVVENNDRKVLHNKLIKVGNTFKINFEDLEEKMKIAKMYILCNPHNPVGRCYQKEELDKIVELCKKYDVALVSDEIHCDIIMEDSKFYSVANYWDQYDKISICTAPSKTFNIAGLYDANIFIKCKEYRDGFISRQNKLAIATPNLLGLTACKSAYLKGGEWTDKQRKYITENRDLVYKFLDENIKEAKANKVEGTYLMFIDFSFLGLNQDELIDGLKNEGVIVNSGTLYSSDYVGYFRFNMACPRKQLIDGLERIKRFVLKHKK